MPRKAEGTVQYRPGKEPGAAGVWWGRITCPDRSRPWIELGTWPNSPQGRARAKEAAAHHTEKAWELGLGGAPKRGPKLAALRAAPAGESFDDYAKRWFAERETRGLSSMTTDRSRIKVHVSPALGPKPMRQISAADLRAVCRQLDERVRTTPGFSWNTARKVWGLVTKLFSDACESKVDELRVLDTNPCKGVRGPDTGEEKGKQWLRPSELVQLVTCPEVPLRWRRLYALASYLYTRPGELAALEWADVHLLQRYVTIHQAIDLETGKLKPTKTGMTRRVPIRPALVPLLTAMKAECSGKGRVVQHTHDNKEAEHGMPPTEDLAATLRLHLERAKVDRADLFADRSTTKRVTFYDLRATGITWEVLDGTDHVAIMQRAGHTNFSTTQGYIRAAETLGENVGEPFGPLPDGLLDDSTQDDSEVCDPSSPESSRESSELDDSFADPAAFLPDPLASPRGFEPLLQP